MGLSCLGLSTLNPKVQICGLGFEDLGFIRPIGYCFAGTHTDCSRAQVVVGQTSQTNQPLLADSSANRAVYILRITLAPAHPPWDAYSLRRSPSVSPCSHRSRQIGSASLKAANMEEVPNHCRIVQNLMP